MYVSWVLDERPTWQVWLTYGLHGPTAPGARDTARLEAAALATGLARRAVVRCTSGTVAVAVLVKGVDDLDATARALAILDSAERDAGCRMLGGLEAHAAAVVGPGVKGVR